MNGFWATSGRDDRQPDVPTVLRRAGFRVFFFSNEGEEPPHVHVERGGGIGIHWPQLDEDLSVRGLLFPHPEDAERVS